MSTQASICTYLRDIVGVVDVPGTNPAVRCVAIQDEGLAIIDDLLEFNEEGIKTLCSSVRKPGGLVTDPNDPNCQITNPGFNIPVIREKRMRWAAYGAKIYSMIDRSISHDVLNRDRLKEFERYHTLLEEHEDPVKLPVVSKTFGIIKAMYLIPSNLRD